MCSLDFGEIAWNKYRLLLLLLDTMMLHWFLKLTQFFFKIVSYNSFALSLRYVL